MALRKITDSTIIPDRRSGIYFRTTDLTVVSKNVGGFSAAAVGLTEKGPAFEITNSANYEQRAFRLGELNPHFPSSYFARQYLEQGRNYKEVRILGLEGYTDVVSFGICFAVDGATAAEAGVSPLIPGEQGLQVVLKKRKLGVTGRTAEGEITKVEVVNVTYIDPVTSISTTTANDYLFGLKITYTDSSTETITTSLRPESNEYIVKKFGTDPLESPRIGNKIASLWVDYITPSTKSTPGINTYDRGYYLPGSSVQQNYLPLLTGDITFGMNTLLQSGDVVDVINNPGDTVVVVSGDITSWLAVDDYVSISNVTGSTNVLIVNNTWKASVVNYNGSNTEVTIVNIADDENLIIEGTVTFSNANSPKLYEYVNPTWQSQLIDFEEVGYQTPITPWFISDGDANGDYKKLYRLWSISDGESANTEIKIEHKNINPAGNNGKGTFDIIIRKWDDREDLETVVLESFSNLTMDPESDNYILRRIGDGEDFQLRSTFVFIEMNNEETLPDNCLPYGHLGYQTVTDDVILDLAYTAEYVLNKPIYKQSLGLANNRINMAKEVAPDQLKYLNSTGLIGKGFHLNPNNNTVFVTAQSDVLNFASQTIYQDTVGNTVNTTEKVKRNKFVTDFYGGFDGWNVYSQRTWNDTNSADYTALTYAVDVLSDKESLETDFTVLTTPDFYFDTHSNASNYVLEMVEARGDALYLPDFSYDELADAVAASALLDASDMKSSAAAVYFPWLQIEDSVNRANKWLPPSLLALGTIAYVANNEQVWQPPGGSIRTVTNNLVRTRKRLKANDREILKAANINPITLFPGSGYEITEVRTTQEQFSALSFIHNTLLLCYAKKVLNQILRPLLFQMNNQIGQDAFLTTVRPIFDRIKKLNGVEEYSVEVVERPELNDRTTLYGKITIVPLYPIERIVIDFVLQDSGVSFNQ